MTSSTGEVQLIRLMVRVSTYRPVLLLLRGPVGAMQVANYKLGAVMFYDSYQFFYRRSSAGEYPLAGRPALPLPTLVKDHSPG